MAVVSDRKPLRTPVKVIYDVCSPTAMQKAQAKPARPFGAYALVAIAALCLVMIGLPLASGWSGLVGALLSLAGACLLLATVLFAFRKQK